MKVVMLILSTMPCPAQPCSTLSWHIESARICEAWKARKPGQVFCIPLHTIEAMKRGNHP